MISNKEVFSLKEASIWASEYLGKVVTTSKWNKLI